MSTFTDPRTGNERNLGQDDVPSRGGWLGIVLLVLVIGFGGFYLLNQPVSRTTTTEPTATTSTTTTTPEKAPAPNPAAPQPQTP